MTRVIVDGHAAPTIAFNKDMRVLGAVQGVGRFLVLGLRMLVSTQVSFPSLASDASGSLTLPLFKVNALEV